MDGCFNSPYFVHCAKQLLLDKEKVETLTEVLGRK